MGLVRRSPGNMWIRSRALALALVVIVAIAGSDEGVTDVGEVGRDSISPVQLRTPTERADQTEAGGDTEREACATTGSLNQQSGYGPIAQKATGDEMEDAEKVDLSGNSDTLGEYAPWSWWIVTLGFCAMLWWLDALRWAGQHMKLFGLNNKLRTYETTLTLLHDEITGLKRSWLLRSALLGVAWCTGGLSKLVQIPYDIAVTCEKRRLGTEFQRVRFEAADLYYCHGGDTNLGLYQIHPELLMKRAEWKNSKASIINKIKGAAKQLKHEHGNYKKAHKWLELVAQDDDLCCPIEAVAEELGIDAVQSAVEDWAMDIAVDIAVAVIF